MGLKVQWWYYGAYRICKALLLFLEKLLRSKKQDHQLQEEVYFA